MAPNKSSARSARGSTRKATSSKTKRTKAKSSTGRKYSPKAGEFVEAEMKEMKRGELKSGRSGKTVHNPKQAIAIGLSEARRSGVKVPPPKSKKAA